MAKAELTKEEPLDVQTEEFTFELTDKDIPRATRNGSGIYREKVEEFMAQPKTSKYLQFSGRKTATVAAGLRRAIDEQGLKGKVSIITRGDDLWLTRK